MIASVSKVTPDVPKNESDNVKASTNRALGLGHHVIGRDHGNQDQRRVDEKDRSVPEVHKQKSADDRSDGDRDAAGRAPHPEGLRAFAQIFKGDRES